MSPSNVNSRLFAVRSTGSLFRLIRFCHLSVIMDEWITFTSTLVPGRYVAVCISVGTGPCGTQSACLGSVVHAMPLTREQNSRGCACETVHLRGFFVISVFALIFGKSNPQRCVLKGFESRFTGGDSHILCVTERAGVASWTFLGRLILLLVFVQ